MHWINIHSSTIDAEEFVGAEPIERATWLCLLRYCAGQENGGTILGCREWSDRKWQQLCRITQAEVMTPSRLWSWIGQGSLVVWNYPLTQQEHVARNRHQAAAAATARWKKRTQNAEKPPKPRKR